MQETLKAPLPLSPVDYLFVGRDSYIVEFLLHFDYPLEVPRLRRSLQAAVGKFWPVGALIAPGADGLWYFKKNSAAIDFVELPASRALPDFSDPAALAAFAAPACSEPGHALASFRVARVGNGSVLVAAISHAVVDGYSYFLFMAVWAAFYRGRAWSWDYWKHRGLRPDLDRRKLTPVRLHRGPEAARAVPGDFYARTGAVMAADERRIPPLRESRWEFVRFSREELQQQLAAASRQTELRLSQHDVLSALLWKKAAREWHATDEDLEIASAFDFRRLHPALSPLYFGNAIRATGLRLRRDQVVNLSLAALAARVREATNAVDLNAVCDSLSCLEETRLAHGNGCFQRVHVSHPQRGLLVTNLSRVPVARLGFGHGAPRRIVPLTPVPRSAIVLAEGNDIVVRLGLG